MTNFILQGEFFLVSWLKQLFFTLDLLIYEIAKWGYVIFCYLAEVYIFSPDELQNFTNRVYALLAIILVFVIAYNLLNYIVDPDKINDKSVGAGTLIKDIIIALAVITLLPTIFSKLYSFQSLILKEAVIPNIIMGAGSPSNQNNKIEDGAGYMVADVYSSFVFPITSDNMGNKSILDCTVPSTDGAFAEITKDDLPALKSVYGDYCATYYYSRKNGTISEYRSLVEKPNEYNYYVIISTVAGIVLIFFTLSYALEMAKRTGKLAVLQFMAPIPLAMEILPGKKGARKRWLDMVIECYLQVFIYQAVIFFTISAIGLVPGVIANLFSNLGDGYIILKIFAMVILIFGLLQFGREAPKLITDLLGLKESGSIGKVAQRALAMGAVGGGLVGSTVGRFARNYNADSNASRGARIRSGLAGATSGIGRTLWNARNVHNVNDARNLRRNTNNAVVSARVRRDNYAATHGDNLRGVMSGHWNDFWGNIGESASRTFVGRNSTEANQELFNLYDEFNKIYNNVNPDFENDYIYKNYKEQQRDILANNGLTREQIKLIKDDYNSWKGANPGGTIGGYLSSSDFSTLLTANPHFRSISTAELTKYFNLQTAMDDRERETKYDKRKKLSVELSHIRAMRDNDPRFAQFLNNLSDPRYTPSANDRINLSDLGELNENASEADFVRAFDAIKKVRNAMEADRRNKQRESANEDYRRQHRGNNGNNNAGGNGGH